MSPNLPLTPKQIVIELDKHIVGQQDAKRAVAIALRNRWRRKQLPDALQQEITPKNILMIGPTGVGKTEIARRIAHLTHAPFIKIEATKFTEVGYVGRDVESIIRDLTEMAMKSLRQTTIRQYSHDAYEIAEEKILDILLPTARDQAEEQASNTRQRFRKMLREGQLDDREIDIEIAGKRPHGVEIMTPPGMEEMTNQLREMFQNIEPTERKQRTLPIKQALKLLTDETAAGLINEEDLKEQVIDAVEQSGIVFIDEIDKIAQQGSQGQDVSRSGVQRDLLPLIEGSTVSTKYGMVKTDHILFIASGAFHLCKPADLIPELQGRLPIRVELSALTTADFVRILTEPDAALTKQYIALMATEQITLSFTEQGIQALAELAYQVNAQTENIGARRLHTLLEKVLESASFSTQEDMSELVIDDNYVQQKLGELVQDEDLSRYIL